MPNLFTFEVYTPYRLFYSDSVEAVTVTLQDGEIGIYANHDFFTAPVIPCVLNIRDKQGQWKAAFTTEGILEVTHHKTVLLVDAAEWPEEIDAPRAEAAKRQAEETLEFGMLKFEIDNAKLALQRAQTRLKLCELKKT
ncbi:MAG: ATP synthase F1 subunit epsilon [Spirochaetaceae bacterium]|jgi:F-type H+-transporting ATPase subunit epsilon|nr:ATP synthase F1 subunit epsilon [Spirochaetaceae bacterium]